MVWTAAAAGQPPAAACSTQTLAAPHNSPQLLRQVAPTCDSAALTDLLYNRAYHAELLERYRSVMRLEGYRGQDDARDYHAYRIFIGLSEALAQSPALQSRAEGQAAAWLNSVYDRATEIAELRLKGYDLIADRLERQAWRR
jgi:hypothetical protein